MGARQCLFILDYCKMRNRPLKTTFGSNEGERQLGWTKSSTQDGKSCKYPEVYFATWQCRGGGTTMTTEKNYILLTQNTPQSATIIQSTACFVSDN